MTTCVSAAAVGPAPAIWRDDREIERVGKVAYFRENGFVVRRGLLKPREVAEAAEALDQIVRRRRDIPNVRVIGTRNPLLPSLDLEDGTEADDGPIRKMTGLSVLSAVLDARLVRPPELLELLHSLIGPCIELYRDAVMFKSAHVGQEKPWHQDGVYWPFRPIRLVSAMIAVDPADVGNGCLQVIPRSHRQILAHAKRNFELQVDIGPLARQARYVELQPGDCLVFHSLLLHASEHNNSPRQRRVSICSYSPGGLEHLDPQQVPPILLSRQAA